MSSPGGSKMPASQIGPEGKFERGDLHAGVDAEEGSGTSVFDPVLCELAYRWFCPPGGEVLDPFAGGSVRGFVAAALGRRYLGFDLRPEQVEANDRQWREIGPRLGAAAGGGAEATISDPEALTPVQAVEGGIWLKRDDLFSLNGARGSKARALISVLRGARGATTAGNRLSPMVSRVARACEALGVPCRAHCSGAREMSEEVLDAQAHGAEIVRHKVNYLSALCAKARKDAEERGWVYVPLGVRGPEYVAGTRLQAADLPRGIRRVVVPVGSGMALASILAGLDDVGLDVPVLGVAVGKDPEAVIEEWAPKGWRSRVELIRAPGKFEEPAARSSWWGVELDPHYEAKAAPFVREGDLLWVVAVRTPKEGRAAARGPGSDPKWIAADSTEAIDLLPPDRLFDFVFSCPPYADLERYSDDPRDLSTMPFEGFLASYRRIIRASVARLRPDRFACFVVGEVRDPASGFYRNLVGETISAFEAAGARYYNEAILVTACGSLPIRAGKVFEAGRKLGKTHQNVLVFVKGDWRAATKAVGPVEFGLPLPEL